MSHLPGGAELRSIANFPDAVELRSTGQMRTSAPTWFGVKISERAASTRYNRTALRDCRMKSIENREPRRNWLILVLTDVHFWVPAAVLIGGLLLLESIH